MYTEITIGTLTATGDTASIHLHHRPLVITGDSGTGKTHTARLITALPATRHMPRYVFDRTNAWTGSGPITGTIMKDLPDGMPQLPPHDRERRLILYRTGLLHSASNYSAEHDLYRRLADRAATDEVPRIAVHDDHHPPRHPHDDPVLTLSSPPALQSIIIIDALHQLQTPERPDHAQGTIRRSQLLLFRHRSPAAAGHTAQLLGLSDPLTHTLRRLDRGNCLHIDPDRPSPRVIAIDQIPHQT